MFILLLVQNGLTAEIDSVTPRNLALINSINEINAIINQRIEEGIQNANEPQILVDEMEDFPFENEDTYCDEEALYTELRKAIFQSLEAERINLDRVFLVCIQEELEAWLLADHRAVTAMLRPLKYPHLVGRISKFRNPDNIANPKKRLTQLFTRELGAGRRYVDYQHAIKIAMEIRDFQRMRRSPSFQRFALKVCGVEL